MLRRFGSVTRSTMESVFITSQPTACAIGLYARFDHRQFMRIYEFDNPALVRWEINQVLYQLWLKGSVFRPFVEPQVAILVYQPQRDKEHNYVSIIKQLSHHYFVKPVVVPLVFNPVNDPRPLEIVMGSPEASYYRSTVEPDVHHHFHKLF